MALRDTLKAIHDKEYEAATFEAFKPQLIEDWQEAIRWLLGRVRSWLVEYEQDGSMTFSDGVVQLDEERLGPYPADTLSIHVGSAVVRLVPVGRAVIGGSGRVDMYRQGRPDDSERIRIFRLDAKRRDRWGMRRPGRLMTRSQELEALTQESFEASLDSLLSS